MTTKNEKNAYAFKDLVFESEPDSDEKRFSWQWQERGKKGEENWLKKTLWMSGAYPGGGYYRKEGRRKSRAGAQCSNDRCPTNVIR